MLRAVLSITVAAIVALHGALGCCWHHTHGSAAVVSEGEVGPAAPTRHACCHRHCEPRRPERVDAGVATGSVEREACCERCDSVATVRTAQDQPVGTSFTGSLSTVEQPAADASRPRASLGVAELPEPPPLRRHLLLQRLLI